MSGQTETAGALRRARDEWLDQHRDELADTWMPCFETSSHIPVKELYTPLDLGEDWDYERDAGFPGQAPFVRGLSPAGYRRAPWKVEMYAGFGSAEDANRRFRYLIDQGSTGGVSIALDLPTQIGLDSDDPSSLDEVGQVGVAIDSLADVERMFDGIPLDQVGHIFTTGNCIGPIAACWLLALARKQGIDPSAFMVQIQNDPIKEYIARGTQFLPIEASVRLATDVIEYARDAAPSWLPISVSGSHMKQAGCTVVEEAAFTICNAIAYVEACLEKGMSIDDFGSSLELHFCTEMDFFEEVAKYRAIRAVWTRLVAERFGGTTPEAFQFRLHATTSGRPLTAQQPLNNIARITMQALAQVLGGCEQTRTASFDEALGIPTEEAARTSIRVNQVLIHETGVPYTVDPLGGSYYVEYLTGEFQRQIDETIVHVDEMGGALEAVRQGFFQRAISDGAYREQVRVDSGEQVIVGVNRFTIDDDVERASFKLDETATERQIAALRRVREERDEDEVRTGLEELRQVCGTAANTMAATLRCVEAYATTGEICAVWRQALGEYTREAIKL